MTRNMTALLKVFSEDTPDLNTISGHKVIYYPLGNKDIATNGGALSIVSDFQGTITVFDETNESGFKIVFETTGEFGEQSMKYYDYVPYADDFVLHDSIFRMGKNTYISWDENGLVTVCTLPDTVNPSAVPDNTIQKNLMKPIKNVKISMNFDVYSLPRCIDGECTEFPKDGYVDIDSIKFWNNHVPLSNKWVVHSRFIDTVHPIFESHDYRINETNVSFYYNE